MKGLPNDGEMSVILAIIALYLFILSAIEDECEDNNKYKRKEIIICSCCIASVVLLLYIIPLKIIK